MDPDPAEFDDTSEAPVPLPRSWRAPELPSALIQAIEETPAGLDLDDRLGLSSAIWRPESAVGSTERTRELTNRPAGSVSLGGWLRGRHLLYVPSAGGAEVQELSVLTKDVQELRQQVCILAEGNAELRLRLVQMQFLLERIVDFFGDDSATPPDKGEGAS